MTVKKLIRSWDEVPQIMDLPYATQLLGVTFETLRKHCQKGIFPGFKVGGVWRVEKDDLKEYIRTNRHYRKDLLPDNF